MGPFMSPPNTASSLRLGACVVQRYESPALDRVAVRRALGLRGSSANARRWEAAIEELSESLPRLARARAMIRLEPVALLERRRLVLGAPRAGTEPAKVPAALSPSSAANNPAVVIEGAVGQFLAHSRLVALFVSTIGSGVERLSRGWLRAGDVIRGLVADAIGSELAEAVAFHCQQQVRAWARAHGLEITPRYSPGYCGMDVRQQRVLFDQVSAARIGVRLTPSCLMTPVKSVSGIIGLAPAGTVSPEDYPCSRCDHPHCMQRRTQFDVRRGSCVDWAECGMPAPLESAADEA